MGGDRKNKFADTSGQNEFPLPGGPGSASENRVRVSAFLFGGVSSTSTAWRRLWGRLRSCWKDNIAYLAWERLRIPQEKLGCVAGERDA